MLKFTPGPWRQAVDASGRPCDGAIVSDEGTCEVDKDYPMHYGGYVVCESVSKDADARLIAAAPEMYAMLIKILDEAIPTVLEQGIGVMYDDLQDLIAKIDVEE